MIAEVIRERDLMGYTIDQIREEALEAVRSRFVNEGLRPSSRTSDSAWCALMQIAQAHPDWRIGRYYWRSGAMEERIFKEEWETWRRSVNG